MTYQCGPILKESQKQVLYGTILGGSSIVKPAKGKNCYLAMRDSNESWLQYKIEYLKDFFKIDVNTIKKDKNTFRCYSVAYPVFNEIYDLFYEKNSKILIPNILECLTDEAWMVWFIDAGRKSKRSQSIDNQGSILIILGNNEKVDSGKILDGTIEKLLEWNKKGYTIILTTGRRESNREVTVKQLQEVGIFYDHLIMGVGRGPRVVINDTKPDGMITAYSVNVVRNEGIKNVDL